MYARCFKRVLDFCCALSALLCLSPLLIVLMLVGTVKMRGNPFFTQPRPGKGEKIFRLVKFRTMTNERDANGNLLPDDVRLNSYGRFLLSTSLDELPELFNILKGDSVRWAAWSLRRRHALFCGPSLRLAARAALAKPSLAPRFQAQGMTVVSALRVSSPRGHDRGCAPRNILQLGRVSLHAERRNTRTAFSYAGAA